MKCALIEYNYYHDETLPTLIYLLNELSIDVDVYTSRRNINNNVFVFSSRLHFSLRCSDGRIYRIKEYFNKYRDYDFIILNSVEPIEIIKRVSHFNVPTLAILHNAGLINKNLDYKRYFSDDKRKIIVLSSYVLEFLSNTTDSCCICPVYLGKLPEDSVLKKPKASKFCFTVQGNLEFSRRNYQSLIDAVDSLSSKKYKNFYIKIVGKNNTEDGLIFKKEVNSKKLEHFFEFSKGEIDYNMYYTSILQSNFLIPLIDTTSKKYTSYFYEKVTTSILLSITLGVSPIVHRDLASLYGIDDFVITYEDGGLENALLQAMNLKNETLNEIKNKLSEKRNSLLKESMFNLKTAMQDLGLRY